MSLINIASVINYVKQSFTLFFCSKNNKFWNKKYIIIFITMFLQKIMYFHKYYKKWSHFRADKFFWWKNLSDRDVLELFTNWSENVLSPYFNLNENIYSDVWNCFTCASVIECSVFADVTGPSSTSTLPQAFIPSCLTSAHGDNPIKERENQFPLDPRRCRVERKLYFSPDTFPCTKWMHSSLPLLRDGS